MIHEHSNKPIEVGQAIDRNHLVKTLGRILYLRRNGRFGAAHGINDRNGEEKPDFDFMSRKEIIKVPRGMGVESTLPGINSVQGELPVFEERWSGGYIFENEWQSFRTRRNRDLELTTAAHRYVQPGRYTVAVKVIDIFGNDTMTLVPVNVG
ncbi:MAG: hypothetical protein Q8Q81_16330 [Oxalobacteraceae bacterium]|nr:hypothetical protein [Oxalobacteraceae bacterium]